MAFHLTSGFISKYLTDEIKFLYFKRSKGKQVLQKKLASHCPVFGLARVHGQRCCIVESYLALKILSILLFLYLTLPSECDSVYN